MQAPRLIQITPIKSHVQIKTWLLAIPASQRYIHMVQYSKIQFPHIPILPLLTV